MPLSASPAPPGPQRRTPQAPKRPKARVRRAIGFGALLLAALGATLVLGARAYLNPARLTHLLQQTLNAQLVGEARIGEVRWQLPSTLLLSEVRLGLDVNAPDLRIAKASARLQLMALLRRQIVVGPIDIERPCVWLGPATAAPPEGLALSAALASKHPAATKPDAKVFDWPISLAGLRISQGEVHFVQPGQTFDVLGLDVDMASARVQLGETQTHIDTSAAIDIAQLSEHSSSKNTVNALRLGPVHVGAEALGVTLAAGHIDVSTHSISARLPGAEFSLSGRARVHTPNLSQSRADARVSLVLDANANSWPQFVSAEIWRQLAPAGVWRLELDAQTQTQSQHLRWTLSGNQIGAMGVPIEALTGDLAWQAPVLSLTDVSLRLPEGTLQLSGKASIASPGVHVGKHNLVLKALTLPARALAQKLQPDAAQLAPTTLQARLQLQGDELWPSLATLLDATTDASFTSRPRPTFLPLSLHAQAAARLTPKAIQLQSLSVQADGARLAATGSAGVGADDKLEAHIVLKALQPQQTLDRLLPALAADSAMVTVDVAGSRRRPEGKAEIHVAKLRYGQNRQGQLDIDLLWTLAHGVVRLRHGQIRGPAAQLSLVGQATLQTPSGRWREVPDVDVELRMARAQLKQLWPDGHVDGDARLNVHISGAANRPHMAGMLRVVGLKAGPLAFREANMQLFGDGTRLGTRQVVLNPKQGGHILGHALLSPQTGGIDAGLVARDVPATWFGLKTPAPAALNLTAGATGTLQATDVTLEAEAGRILAVSADARVAPAKSLLRLDVRGHAALESLAEWVEGSAGLSGELTLDMHADGDWHTPNLSLQMQGDGLYWGSQALGNQQLRWTAQTRAHGLYASKLDLMDLVHIEAAIDTTGGVAIDANARFDALRAGSVVAGLTEHGNDATVTGGAHVHWALPHDAAAAELSAALDIEALEARAAGRTMVLKQPWQLRVTPDTLCASWLKLGGTAGVLEARADLNGAWLDPSPTAQAHSLIEATAQGTLDLDFVAGLIPAMGHAEGEIAWTGRLSGNLAEPVGMGSLRVDKEWVLRPRGTLIEVHIAQGEARIDKQRLSLHHIEGNLEAGTFALGGHIDLAGLRPKAYQIHLSASDLPLHTPDLVLEANVVADASGEGLLPLIKGRIDVTRGRFLKKLEFKDFNFVNREPDTSAPLTESAPWLRELRLDLLATSSNGVDIRLDAGAFAVEATLQTDLHITGNALVPHVVGRINAERGSLHFPKADLQLTQAQLDFEPTPKDPLGAALNVQADGEITPSSSGGTSAQTYSVALRVDGPLKELQFELSSDQGLGKLEILSLLTTGHASLADLTSGSSDDGSQLDAALAFAGSQVSGPLTQLAERQLERALNLRLELNAEVTQENVRLTAAKNLNRRLRLEGAYTHGIAAEQSIVSTRAQLSLTDKLLLEGTAARDLSGAATSGSSGSIQSNVELKYRLVGH